MTEGKEQGWSSGHRPNRRQLIAATAILPIVAATRAAGRPIPRLLFVHGRAQGDRSQAEIKKQWLIALTEGARVSGHEMPEDLDVALPFYGKELDDLVAEVELPLASDISKKGDTFRDEFLIFQEEVASQLRVGAGITDAQVDEIYGDNPRERAPENWEWVQAIIEAIDRFSPNVTKSFLEFFLRDVFLYLESSKTRSIIDGIVSASLDERPTIVVAHSLGTLVIYNILQDREVPEVPLLVTLGSPLGIKAIQRNFRPLRFPTSVRKWINAFDERDVVALNPLDTRNFFVTPSVENISDIRNQTDNRHGISGYLDKAQVTGRIFGD